MYVSTEYPFSWQDGAQKGAKNVSAPLKISFTGRYKADI